MHTYAYNMQTMCRQCADICIKYAQICHNIDFNIAHKQIICIKYAKNMLNMQQKYAKNANNMQNMHKSMYWHILHIYALPTLLMEPLCSGAQQVVGDWH